MYLSMEIFRQKLLPCKTSTLWVLAIIFKKIETDMNKEECTYIT